MSKNIGHLQTIVKKMQQKKSIGFTTQEYEFLTGLSHGKVSGAFSKMHAEGLLVRLKEKRGKHSVYVLPEWVKGRETVGYGREKKADPGQEAVYLSVIDARNNRVKYLEAVLDSRGIKYDPA